MAVAKPGGGPSKSRGSRGTGAGSDVGWRSFWESLRVTQDSAHWQSFSSSPSQVLLTIGYTLGQALPKRSLISTSQKPHQEWLQKKQRVGKFIGPRSHSC